MKNNHVAQSTAGVKPNNRLDPTDVSDVKRELLKQAPSKSKRKRMKKAQKAAAKKRAAEREAALERGETLQVPVNDQESISLRLEKDELVIGGVADTVSPSDQLTE
uniref:Uncharacterized protein n=1 Tax=viral metagenome TaxID=1070528 RepID=A0A6C0BNM3_9ZZZZ